jgi:membrane protease YdiL (CAAX protease family)
MQETNRVANGADSRMDTSLSMDVPTEPIVRRASAELGYRELLYVVLFACASFVAVGIACLTLLLGLEALFGWEVNLEKPLTEALMLIVVQAIAWMLILVFVYFLVTVKHGMEFRRVIGWIPLTQPFSAGPLYCLTGVGLACLVVVIASMMPLPNQSSPFEDLLRDPSALLLVTAFGITVFPVVEEISFRGFFFAIMERIHGTLIAVVITSTVFSIVHGPQYGWQWQSLTLLFCVGSIFAAVRVKTKSIVPVILVHSGYNATLLLGALFSDGASGKL